MPVRITGLTVIDLYQCGDGLAAVECSDAELSRKIRMPKNISVWDPLVRVGHWTVVIAFAVAYFTEEDLLSVHVWAGYVVGSAVLIRVLWGFVGPNRARFFDFIYPPRAVFTYLGDLIRFRARRYVGHSPAGGAMVVALLLMLAATVVTGVMTLGADKHAGPLASLYAAAPIAGSPAKKAISDGTTRTRSGERGSGAQAERQESTLRELHEVLANVTLILVGFHLAGVALASFVHRENLVLAMLAGRKRAESA